MIRHVGTAVLFFVAVASAFGGNVRQESRVHRNQPKDFVQINPVGIIANPSNQPVMPDAVNTRRWDATDASSTTRILRRSDGKYVACGFTTSDPFANVEVLAQSSRNGAGVDGFVALFSADLRTIEYLQFLSASKDERATDIDFLANGDVCVVGYTDSPDFPVMGTSFGQTRGIGTDAFVAVFSSDLKTQRKGMLVAGNGNDVATGVVVNQQGHIIVVGNTSSTAGISALKVMDDTANGGVDGFVYILNSSMLYADFFTYLGGVKDDFVSQVALDAGNNAVLCGTTKSEDFYTFPKKIRIPIDDGGGGKGDPEGGDGGEGSYKEVGKNPYNHVFNGGETDAFVAKFGSSGEIVYSTFFGGSGADEATGLFIDANDGAFIVGTTASANLPTESSSTLFAGGTDGFAAVITSDGLRLSGATYLGGTKADEICAVSKFDATNALIIGRTTSTDLPLVGTGSVMGTRPGVFVAKISTTAVTFSSGMIRPGDVFPSCMVTDQFGDIVFGGSIVLPQMPQAGTADPDAYVGKWAFGVLGYKQPLGPDALCAGSPVSIQWTADGFNGQPIMAIDCSTDAGTTWIPLASNVKGKQQNVVLPGELQPGMQVHIRVTTDRGHTATSPTALQIQTAPVITEQPLGVVACPSTLTTLSVVNTDPQAKVQWRFNGVNIQGATGNTLTLTALTTANAGEYDAVVSNSCGSISSAKATVQVTDVPIIDQQPEGVAVDAGASVTLTTAARGTNVRYQWSKDGNEIAGATSQDLVLQNVTANDAGAYSCKVTSDCGSVNSNVATITINGVTDVGDDRWSGEQVSAYPQPSAESVTIVLPPTLGSVELTMYATDGSVVYQTSVQAGDNRLVPIAVRQLPVGRYTLRCTTGTASTSIQLLVVR